MPYYQGLWLSQESYIEKTGNRFSITTRDRKTTVPLSLYTDLSIHENHQATLDEFRAYQERVGSINWLAVQTRPDAAKAASTLAQYLANPTKRHLAAADHCIRYLLESKELSIQFGGSSSSSNYLTSTSKEFLGASDASFADDTNTRRSSEGWLFQLFNGPIDWKATKQQTVTKSSTDAELLSLSHAGSEMIWWKRFFKAIDLTLEETPVLYCDNQQTLRLVTNTNAKSETKLRHVDIHNHWLRQEHLNQTIKFDWLPTAHMPADGLTKLLSPQKQSEFIKQLNLAESQIDQHI